MWNTFLANKKKIVAAVVGLVALLAASFFNLNISSDTQNAITNGVVQVLPEAPANP